jgi:hypothetical protein
MKPAVAIATILGCFAGILPLPCKALVSIRGELTHERQLRPGERYEGAIRVNNTGDEPEEIEIYKTDYRFDCRGNYYYDPPGESPRSNANWIAFSPHKVAIPPQGTVIVNYALETPPDQDLIGTYWSILMIEHAGDGAHEVSAEDGQEISVGVDQVIRYAIQIVTHIGDTGERKLEFLDTELLREGSVRVLHVDIGNVGERWLRPTLWTELYSKDGSYVGRFEGGKLRVYPGTSARFNVDLSEAEQGEYKALVVADCDDNVFGATYSLVIEK